MSAPEARWVLELLLWRKGRARPVHVYPDLRDWWVGYYRSERHHHLCVVPCIVLRIPRRERHG